MNSIEGSIRPPFGLPLRLLRQYRAGLAGRDDPEVPVQRHFSGLEQRRWTTGSPLAVGLKRPYPLRESGGDERAPIGQLFGQQMDKTIWIP
jgi:hypothetical protein